MHLENQCLNPIYIHAKKKDVYLMHNKAFVIKDSKLRPQEFEVSQSKLLLDLGEDDQSRI